jgi:hypothetical protein
MHLRLAREAGHPGRLCGLDPAGGMLNQARQRPDIEWVHGDLSSVQWEREFGLVVMTGHAFQELVEDDEVRRPLNRNPGSPRRRRPLRVRDAQSTRPRVSADGGRRAAEPPQEGRS